MQANRWRPSCSCRRADASRAGATGYRSRMRGQQGTIPRRIEGSVACAPGPSSFPGPGWRQAGGGMAGPRSRAPRRMARGGPRRTFRAQDRMRFFAVRQDRARDRRCCEVSWRLHRKRGRFLRVSWARVREACFSGAPAPKEQKRLEKSGFRRIPQHPSFVGHWGRPCGSWGFCYVTVDLRR